MKKFLSVVFLSLLTSGVSYAGSGIINVTIDTSVPPNTTVTFNLFDANGVASGSTGLLQTNPASNVAGQIQIPSSITTQVYLGAVESSSTQGTGAVTYYVPNCINSSDTNSFNFSQNITNSSFKAKTPPTGCTAATTQ